MSATACFLIGFIIGSIIGTYLGLLVLGLCNFNKRTPPWLDD